MKSLIYYNILINCIDSEIDNYDDFKRNSEIVYFKSLILKFKPNDIDMLLRNISQYFLTTQDLTTDHNLSSVICDVFLEKNISHYLDNRDKELDRRLKKFLLKSTVPYEILQKCILNNLE